MSRRLWLRKLHFYSTSLCNGFALCTLLLQLPDIAVQAYADPPDACNSPHSVACRTARSQASLVIGLSNGAKAFVALLIGPALGALSDVHGRQFFWIGSQLICAISYVFVVLHLLGYCSLFPFFFVNAFSGLLLPASLAVVADENKPENRATAFGLLIATLDVSILIGPVLLAGVSLLLASGLAVVGSFVGIALSVAYGESLPHAQRLPASSGSLHWRPDVALSILKSSPLFRRLSFIIVASTLPMAGLQQCFLLFLETAYDLPRSKAGGFFAILAIGGLVVQVALLPILVRRCGVIYVLLIGLLMQLAQSLALGCIHSQSAVVVGCLFGGFSSLVFPSVSALKANAAPPAEQGRVQGAVSALQNFALGIGPLLYGGVFSFLVGPHSPMGRPFPEGVFVVSVLVIVPAGVVSRSLWQYLPGNVECDVPIPRRDVSAFSMQPLDKDCGQSPSSPASPAALLADDPVRGA